jgi:hypothetical protein
MALLGTWFLSGATPTDVRVPCAQSGVAPFVRLLSWSLLTVSLGLASSPPARADFERDIAAVKASRELTMEEAPQIFPGHRVLGDLKEALTLLSTGVPDSARPPLEEVRMLLADASDPGASSPALFPGSGGERWMPVAIQVQEVELDAPATVPRATEHALPGQSQGPPVDNLTVVVRRTAELPVARTDGLVAQALQLLGPHQLDRSEARSAVSAAIDSVRWVTSSPDAPLLKAYYAVQQALAQFPNMTGQARDALRQAAESLAKAEASKTLARDVQGLADRTQPDLSAMLRTSTRLRARLQANAKQQIHHWFE